MRVGDPPVGHVMVGVESADSGNSLVAVSTMLIDYGVPGIPVTEDGRYAGMVFEDDIVSALASGQGPETSALAICKPVPPVSGRGSTAEALRLMHSCGVAALAVTDDLGRVLGVVTASRLLATNDRYAKPKLVGGMATPGNVRLLGGGATGGAKNWELVMTGALMLLTFLAGNYLALAVSWFVPVDIRITDWYYSFHNFLSIAFFLVLLRLQPLAGYHAAEHMVVHAIEQNEPLELETVARMPRVHPRCGTNIAVAAGLFFGLLNLPVIPWEEVRLLLAFVVTLFGWRPIGSFIQSAFTTKPPNEVQLRAGIRAGRELLENYQTAKNASPPIHLRIWQSGILHAMAGSSLTASAAYAVLRVLPIPDYWKVI
ncbi:MAG: DUF1385 domain-containing protein [Armatimonadetes bacterium]|nr:DUF1385 domain-containing protein [Armatimonadota bacterium]MBX3108341.1 DUF1385 domain-containing protein [Fimbriimonadaceae bacterium]